MIIIDIDMPTGCSSCPIYDGEYGECQLRTCFPSRFADVHALFDDRPNNCPLKDRPHGEWIPCSERLPEEFDDVLCSTDAEEVFIATYLGKMNDGTDCFDDNEGMMWEGDVVAWMPLPEPYKKEGEQ